MWLINASAYGQLTLALTLILYANFPTLAWTIHDYCELKPELNV